MPLLKTLGTKWWDKSLVLLDFLWAPLLDETVLKRVVMKVAEKVLKRVVMKVAEKVVEKAVKKVAETVAETVDLLADLMVGRV